MEVWGRNREKDIKHSVSSGSGHRRDIVYDFLRVVLQARWDVERERGRSELRSLSCFRYGVSSRGLWRALGKARAERLSLNEALATERGTRRVHGRLCG